jgi:hypothetical protein
MPAGDRNRESLAGTKASYIVCRPGKGIGIYDEQFRRLMSTGRNSPSKKAAKRTCFTTSLVRALETNSQNCPNCRLMNSRRATTTRYCTSNDRSPRRDTRALSDVPKRVHFHRILTFPTQYSGSGTSGGDSSMDDGTALNRRAFYDGCVISAPKAAAT